MLRPYTKEDGKTCAYSYTVEGADYEFTVVTEKDAATELWTWRAFTHVGYAGEATVDGTYPKLLLTLQEEPMLLYTTPEAAYLAAKLVISGFEQA